MKKLLVCLCLVIVVLLGCAAADEAKTIKGGSSLEDAYEITTADYGKLLKIGDEQYCRIKAPSDGTYVFRGEGSGGITLKDKNGKNQEMLYVNHNMWKSASIEVVKNQVIYVYFYSVDQFTICFDGYHIPCDIETVTREATCTEAGEITILCELCDEVAKTQSIPAKGHREGAEDVITPATCLNEGLRGTSCTVCSEILSSTRIPVANHTPGVWQDLKPTTCTSDGIRKQYCTVCNVTLATEEVAAFGHSPSEWRVTAENGCLHSGKRVKTCAICQAVIESETLPALAHTWSEWAIDIEPTKSAEGRQSRYCTHCGEIEFATVPKEEKFLGIF